MNQQHGTNSGYQRHRRAGERACPKCREAHRVYRAGLRAKTSDAAAAGFAEALNAEPEVSEGLDVLADHRENLRYVRAAMRDPGAVRSVASLSKRRAELVAVIAQAEAASRPGSSVWDQIAERRRARREGLPRL
ncbi:hypothetical protein ACH9DO_16545 [Kocuria sp. M1N1S27]|uniref:hypothetical protein n=1 Tax=Kocuria kalidii TaxID=3376283 RepID=UPI00378EAF93